MKTIIKNSIFFFLIILTVNETLAIPAFARKYNMTCKTCHSPFPALKDYGDEFAGNGFVLSDQDAPRYFVETGDEQLSLLREIPLALRLEGYVTYNNANEETGDFTAPYLLKILSGGSIAKDVAYYFYFFLSERGDVAGVEDAYIMFNNLFGTELDVYVGQFQVSDPLFKRELRLTFDDYNIYKTKVGVSSVDLTYDRGIMLTYGFETGTDIIFEVINGSGIGGANSIRNFDNDNYKNLAGRISQDIGDNFRVGGFGYWGNEEKLSNKNETFFVGPDFTVSLDPVELNVQYLQREDKDPFFINSEVKIKTKGAMAELVLRPDGDNSTWYSVAMFNWVESTLKLLNNKTGTLHFGYMLSRNLRLVTEYSHNFTEKFGRIGAGFIAAF